MRSVIAGSIAGGMAALLLSGPAWATTDYPSGYTKCAKEGESCSMTGTRSVAFGKSGTFVYATLTGTFTCDAALFPSNTITGTRYCSYAATTTSSSSSSSTSSISSSSSSSKASSSSSSSAASSTSSASSSSSATGKQVENLGRGAVAVPASSGMLVSWRLLGTESSSIGFNVYRNGSKLNSSVITGSTNYLDTSGTTSSAYTVVPVLGGVEQTAASATVFTKAYLKVALSQPAGGTSPDGVAYTYDANDGSVADLDGDGEYEIILKWQPTNAKDNSQSGYTGATIVDAYKLNGTRLWRINLGNNIRAGAHYTQIVAYDLDGDGKAEVMMKTADGSVDGKGTVIGSNTADYRNSSGYILSGPEYLTVFNGQTGAAMATTNYLPARGTVSSWGDSYGNRVDRFLAGVAYLDGKRPSAVFARGYYTRAVVVAWDWRDGKLTQRWTYDSGSTSGVGAYGEGAHFMTFGDVDSDGKDEIIYGAAAIDDNGSLLYRTGLLHGDALHLGKFNPSRSGLQVVMPHEDSATNGNIGFEMHDAATGKVLWSLAATTDVGRGVVADVDENYPGEESWSTLSGFMSASGVTISTTKKPSKINFAVWWDGDLMRELLDDVGIYKWSSSSQALSTLLDTSSYGTASNNSTKATPVLSADIFGDWREEVILRSSDNTSLLIFSTPTLTSYRFPTLMHDPQYRVQVAAQNSAYNQPPHPSFYLGSGMGAVTLPAIYVAK